MSITVRTLSEAGIGAFATYLDDLTDGGTGDPPMELLEDPAYSMSLETTVSIDPTQDFSDKIEFGRYLAEQIEPIRQNGTMDRHIGFWSWLALCYFERICPALPDRTRKPGAAHRYILSQDFKHHYRHLVRTPCLVYALHGERSRIVLSGELHKHGEASEQILSREHLFTNGPLFDAMDQLYIRSESSGEWYLKRGARGRVGGSIRRLGKIVRQFDLTYDLRAMTGDQIITLLPREFDRFKRDSA